MAQSEEYRRGFQMGALVGALVVAAILIGGWPLTSYFLRGVRQETAERQARIEKLRAENDQQCEELARKQIKMADEKIELYSQATLLMEPQASPQTALFVLGLDALAPGLGRALAQTDKNGGSAARWYIPLKVTPVVYGDAQGATYLWYDRKTEKLLGPFAPENER